MLPCSPRNIQLRTLLASSENAELWGWGLMAGGGAVLRRPARDLLLRSREAPIDSKSSRVAQAGCW